MTDTPNPVSTDAASDPARSLAGVLTEYGGVHAVRILPVDRPVAGPGQVLVRTEAAGVNPFDHKLRGGHLTDDFPVEFPHVMGLELAGVVVEVGDDVTSFAPGERVMGELRADQGAFSQFVAVDADKLCRTPDELSALQAAAIPSVALTAWGALHALKPPAEGMTVLVHGASGNVGNFAVQFAAAAGARVYGTASAKNADYVLERGAVRVFDRHHERPSDTLSDVDLVIDTVGGDSVDELWDLLASDGALVSVADPNITDHAPAGAHTCWYKMVFDGERLKIIARDVAAGRVKSTIAQVVPFDQLPTAIETVGTGHGSGKIVVAIP